MVELQTGKAVTCTGCAQQIVGEYIVHKKNGKGEYYHTHCARSAGLLQLPVKIKFTEWDNNEKK